MPHEAIRQVRRAIARGPMWLVRRWHYKSAIASALIRGALFFATNVSAGLAAAVSALTTEFWFRFATAGFHGALTQAFRHIEPPRAGTLGAIVVVPLVAHSLEFAVHWWRRGGSRFTTGSPPA